MTEGCRHRPNRVFLRIGGSRQTIRDGTPRRPLRAQASEIRPWGFCAAGAVERRSPAVSGRASECAGRISERGQARRTIPFPDASGTGTEAPLVRHPGFEPLPLRLRLTVLIWLPCGTSTRARTALSCAQPFVAGAIRESARIVRKRGATCQEPLGMGLCVSARTAGRGVCHQEAPDCGFHWARHRNCPGHPSADRAGVHVQGFGESGLPTVVTVQRDRRFPKFFRLHARLLFHQIRAMSACDSSWMDSASTHPNCRPSMHPFVVHTTRNVGESP